MLSHHNPLHSQFAQCVASDRRSVSRHELAKYAEAQGLSPREIFECPIERIDRDTALRMLQIEIAKQRNEGNEFIKATEALRDLALLKIAGILDINHRFTISSMIAGTVILRGTIAMQAQKLVNLLPYSSGNPLLVQAISMAELFKEAVRSPITVIQDLFESIGGIKKNGASDMPAIEGAKDLLKFASVLRKLPVLKFPSEKKVRGQLSRLVPADRDQIIKLLLEAKTAQNAVDNAIQSAEDAASELMRTVIDSSDRAGRGEQESIRAYNRADDKLKGFITSLFEILSYSSSLGFRTSLGMRALRSSLIKSGFIREQRQSRSSSQTNTTGDLSPGEKFNQWWVKTARETAETQPATILIRAIAILTSGQVDGKSRAILGDLRTELEKIPAVQRVQTLDRLLMEGTVTLEQRRQTECWILGEDLVTRGFIRIARDAYRDLIPDKSQRGELILNAAEKLDSETVQKCAGKHLECAELLVDTESLTSQEVGALLIKNPRILGNPLDGLESITLLISTIDSDLANPSVSADFRTSVRKAIASLEGRTPSELEKCLSAILKQIVDTTAKAKNSSAQAIALADESPAQARGDNLHAGVTSVSSLTVDSPVKREYLAILSDLRSDDLCSRWDAREIMATIAGFSKKSRLWMGESYFRTENLRRNVNALLGYQIPSLIGTLRFLSREGVVGHLGYKGGATVASLNPNLEMIGNKPLKRAMQYLRQMIDPQLKAEIVALIKRDICD